jgi:cohesin complex subunit SCC1
MFYSTQILAKKGPLGTIWIAAHLDRRLRRYQVFETNISISVGVLLTPHFVGVSLKASCKRGNVRVCV